MLGPTVGAVFTILLAETLRVIIGTDMVGLDATIYGFLLVLFIIFLPRGILGTLLAWLPGRPGRATAPLGPRRPKHARTAAPPPRHRSGAPAGAPPAGTIHAT